MPLILVLAIFVPLCLLVADAAGKKFSEAAPAVFLGAVLVLYLLGIFSLLGVAVWLLYALWACALVYVCSRLVRWLMKKGPRPTWFGLGLFAFVVAAALLWWLCRGRRYANWDEYTHWGRAVKAIFYQDVLPVFSSVKDDFKEYAPGLAPLQALVLKAGWMPFREDVVTFIQGLFSAALLLYPLHRFSGRGNAAGAALGVLLFLAPIVVYWRYYTETTVDGLLGVLFAFILLVHFLGAGGRYELMLQCMACAVLPLVKTSGILFAVMALVIIWVDAARARRAAEPAAKGRLAAARQTAPLCGTVCAVGAAASWALVVHLTGVPRRWSADVSLGGVWNFITGNGEAWRYETAKNYAANIFADRNYGWPAGFMPYMGFFILFVLLFWALCRLVPQHQKARVKTGFWGMWGAGLLYTLLVLVNYLFMFSEYEAVLLASLSRYLNTWVCAMMVFMVGLLALALPAIKVARQLAALVGTAAVWVLFSNPAAVLGGFVNATRLAGESATIQNQYSAVADAIRAADDSEVAAVYVVAIDDIGATGPRLDYELIPQSLPDQINSIGTHYAEDDLLSLRITPQQWATMLVANYRYVYLYQIDDAFIEDFGVLFEDADAIAPGTMYRVLVVAGQLVLTAV